MIDRFKSLRKLDRRRLDSALMRIQGRPLMMTLFNLGLLGINALSNVKRFVKLALNKLKIINLDPATSSDSFNFLPETFENSTINLPLSVLIVCEVTIPQCLRYRVEQKIEQLELLGLHCKWMNWTDYFEVKNQIHFHDVVIFYRIPGYPKAMANINYATRLGKIVIYDTDDLIYDRETLTSYYNKSTGQLSNKELTAVLNGADIYKKAILACEYAITTTDTLKQSLEKLLGSGKVFILPNALDKYSTQAANNAMPVKRVGEVTLFYGSGSKTHDEDFALISSTLVKLFDQYKDLRLLIVGYLTLPEKLIQYKSRITQIEFLGIEEYFHVLSHADINLAPLKSGLFADCKSEIKWLEAGVLKIPTVTSDTHVYRQAIAHSKDGYIATDADDWHAILAQLISQPALRHEVGQAAYTAAKQSYSVVKISKHFNDILININQQQILKPGVCNAPEHVKHIVIVNVLYAPIAMGGATVITENIVTKLHNDYVDQYRVSVFTCDINNIYAYQLKEYEHKGVNVTAVSVPVGPEVDSRPYDDYIKVIFEQYLDYQKPDLIHFHSIQRLTASMLQAAINKEVPFAVTVHDAWWLSDHQFLVDALGNPVDQLQTNVMVAAKTSENVSQTVNRSTRLKTLLNKADQVLAVSNYQAEFYQHNGINNVVVNANGVDALDISDYPNTVQHSDSDDKVVLGYSGSICHHKGYYFLKEIIENTALDNIELKVIQFDLTEPRFEEWNKTRVEFLPKFDSANMAEFYQQIDVLIAPSMWPESFGLITREAALAGLWVIASDAGGLAESLVQDKNGFKYELGRADQLKQILINMNNNTGRYNQPVPQQDRNSDTINSVDQHIRDLVVHYKNILSSRTS